MRSGRRARNVDEVAGKPCRVSQMWRNSSQTAPALESHTLLFVSAQILTSAVGPFQSAAAPGSMQPAS